MEIYLSFAIWLLVLLLVSLSVQGLLRRVWGGRWVRPLFFPAVVVRQLSAALWCMLTFSRIRAVHVLDGDAAQVEHDKPNMWILGEVLIALAPVLGCGLALWQAGLWLEADMDFHFSLPRTVVASVDGVTDTGKRMMDIANGASDHIWTHYMHSWTGVLFLYLGVGLTTFMAPDKRKLGYATLGIFLFTGAIWAYDELNEGPWLGIFQYGQELIQGALWPPISFFVSLQVFTLAVCLVTAGIAKLLGLYGVKSKGS